MKIFHKKFLNQDETQDNMKIVPVQEKPKLVYFLNQIVIWGVIFTMLYFIFKFITVNINF
jgi:flagellar biosynthesis/type III secretory pathway M-ring protein FliF/YscJ